MTDQDPGPADSSTARAPHGDDNNRSNLSSVSADHQSYNASVWTQVTSDNRLFHDLLQICLSLDTGYRVVLALSPFLDDMKLGRTDYCSSSLVNAVLALASICHAGKEVYASIEQCEEHAEAFRKESYQHLTQHADSLPDVQALGILSVYEVTKGNDKLAIKLSGECVQLAEKLDLHNDLPSVAASSTSTTMHYYRLVTFLTCWQIDSIFCVVANTPSSLDTRQFVRLIHFKPAVTNFLLSCVASNVSTITRGIRDSLYGEITVMFSWFELGLLIEENLSIFYRSQEPLTQSVVVRVHSKYQNWYENLPSELVIDDNSPLRVLLLHCHYYIAILLLFRPFYKLRLTQEAESPKKRCLHAAGMICDIIDSLSLRTMLLEVNPMLIIFYLSNTNLHFIMEVPLQEAAVHLRRGVRLLKDILIRNPTTCQSLEYLAEIIAQNSVLVDAETAETLAQARNLVRSERLYIAYRAEMQRTLVFLRQRIVNTTDTDTTLTDGTAEASTNMQSRGFVWNSE